MNIACVTAHPDDVELLCAGTMIKYIQKGHKVTIIIVTNGEIGSCDLSKEETIKTRYAEAKEGAGIIGFAFKYIPRQSVDRYICESRPSLIISRIYDSDLAVSSFDIFVLVTQWT